MDRRIARLRTVLQQYRSAVIAFSGGVDSSLLAYAAARNIPRVLAVTADSETYGAAELRAARTFARIHRIPHRVIHTRELESERFRRNAPDRCFHCKRELFERLERIRATEGYDIVMDATNTDDVHSDVRPGRRAAALLGVAHPLVDAGLSKTDIREISRRWKLATHDRPAAACLASRIPFGTPITAAVLRRVAAAEKAVRTVWQGFFRVRHDADNAARLELLPSDFARFFRSVNTQQLVRRLHRIGYESVTVDLDGYLPAGVRYQLRHRRWRR